MVWKRRISIFIMETGNNKKMNEEIKLLMETNKIAYQTNDHHSNH